MVAHNPVDSLVLILTIPECADEIVSQQSAAQNEKPAWNALNLPVVKNVSKLAFTMEVCQSSHKALRS